MQEAVHEHAPRKFSAVVGRVAHQLDEVIGHGLVVIVDCVHDCIDQDLLVLLTQLRHVAEVHIGDAPVSQRKDVARMRVAVEQAELRSTPGSQAGHMQLGGFSIRQAGFGPVQFSVACYDISMHNAACCSRV